MMYAKTCNKGGYTMAIFSFKKYDDKLVCIYSSTKPRCRHIVGTTIGVSYNDVKDQFTDELDEDYALSKITKIEAFLEMI